MGIDVRSGQLIQIKLTRLFILEIDVKFSHLSQCRCSRLGISDDSGVGAVWIFNRQGAVWTQQGNKLVGSDYVGASQQGYSLSMSGDGNTLCVGGAYDNSALGAMWIFTRTGVNWTQQGSKLVGSGYSGGTPGVNVFQGVSSSLTTSGNKLVVGGSGDSSSVGAVWTFI